MSKKPSIREFVTEEELKFQLYLMKYTSQLKQIEEKSIEEIILEHEAYKQKRLNSYNKVLEQEKASKDPCPIVIESVEKNIKYTETLLPQIDKETIYKNFEESKLSLQEFLNERLLTLTTPDLIKRDKKTLEYLKTLELTTSTSKEKFGQMLLLIIKNLATMPSFSGYTENWKTDFFSNAIEKTLLYMSNFDSNLLSKRTGQESKAFAYITQICFNAFVNVINIRKKDQEFIKSTIVQETSNEQGVHNMHDEELEDVNKKYNGDTEYTLKLDSDLNFYENIEACLRMLNESNNKHRNNSIIKKEIKYLQETEKIKDSYFYDHIKALESGIQDAELDFIDVLRVERIPNSTIQDSEIINIIEHNPYKVRLYVVKQKNKKEEKIVDNSMGDW